MVIETLSLSFFAVAPTFQEDVTKLSAPEIQHQLDQIRKAELLQVSVTQVRPSPYKLPAAHCIPLSISSISYPVLNS